MSSCDQNSANLPKSATAGLNFQAVVDDADYPAQTWGAVAYLRGPSSIDITATADGSRHVFAVDAATTRNWPPGKYWYSIRATSAGDVAEISSGEIQVVPDISQAGAGYDGSSENEKALAAIDAVLGKRATLDQERYKINNRELWRTPIADLLKLRSFYAMAVRREKGGRGFGRAIHVRFSYK